MLLFPDTNFFMQCKSPAELPWGEITVDEEVRLFATRTVQREIDRFKGDGNGRRSQRAKKVSSWFAQILETGNPYVFREHTPKVTLDLPSRISPGHQYSSTLDVSRDDDRIVGEVMAYTGGKATLLTADTNMKVTARDEGLSYIGTPDTWRLPTEPDQKDRLIAELQKQVKLLEASGPEISVEWNVGGERKPEINEIVYEPIAAAIIDEFVDAVHSANPIETDFSRENDIGFQSASGLYSADFDHHALAHITWQAPSEKAISDYQTSYETWLKQVRSHLEQLHDLLPESEKEVEIHWNLRNIGSQPAEGLILDIEALGRIRLIDPKTTRSRPSSAIPRPPEPPRWKKVQTPLMHMIALQDRISNIRDNFPGSTPISDIMLSPRSKDYSRDPGVFYWREKPATVMNKRWTFECADYRHGGEPEAFPTIIVAVNGAPNEKAALHVRASARNLRVPFEATLPIKITQQVKSSADEARALVEQMKRHKSLIDRIQSRRKLT